jgi:uncharacterized protein
MREKDAFALSDILKESGCPEIDILGGEPMLVPWMKEFIEHATASEMTVNISTNGSLPHIVKKLSKINTGLLNIGFSLHGFSETHKFLTGSDNFSHAIRGIQIMVANNKNPIVKSTLTRGNMDEIGDLVKYLGELGVQRYYLLHEDIIGRPDLSSCVSYPEFQKRYTELSNSLNACDIGFVAASGFYKHGTGAVARCDAGLTKIAVMPDGSAFPCNLFAGFKEFRLGNIFQDGIEKIWNNPILAQLRNSQGNRCRQIDCNHYLHCSGGCPAHSYFFYGSIDMPDPRCNKR